MSKARKQKENFTTTSRRCGLRILATTIAAALVLRSLLAMFNMTGTQLALLLKEQHWKKTSDDSLNHIPKGACLAKNSSKKMQWGVMTTILEVNSAVEHFVMHYSNNACLVVVGDHKTNHTLWREFEAKHSDSLVYLSPRDQNNQSLLDYNIMKHLPWNHFGRKNVGFLFAIAQGARLIYDFDDDNHLTSKSFLEAFSGMSVLSVRMLSNHHVWNPYPYFKPTLKDASSGFVWPRGFPLQFVNDPETYQTIQLERSKKTVHDLAVVQSLADHDPDVDGIYRMTQQLPIRFARRGAVLIAPRGTFVPWNAQATLIRPAAFFGLLLPVTVSGRVTDIWRSYIALRLLWETSEEVGFSSSIVKQFRNPHSYMQDFLDEDDLYKKVDLLLETLSSWTSNGFATLDRAYLDIVTLLVEKDIFQRRDLDLARAWVRDLARLGYEWPPIAQRMEPFVPRTRPVVDQRDMIDEVQDIERPGDTTFRLSFVFTLRNDNYVGQNVRARNAICILQSQLSQFATSYRQAEIIIVEWNPVPDKVGVSELVNQCDIPPLKEPSPHVHVRIIVVPANVTQRGSLNPQQTPFLEFMAKNVGIRRARGDWIVATNPDDLFTTSLVRILMMGFLNNDFFYVTRLIRMDLRAHPGTAWFNMGGPKDVPLEISNTSSAAEILAWLSSDNATRRILPVGNDFCDVLELSQNESDKFYESQEATKYPRTGASGDFTMASRKTWNAVGGYPEVPRGRLDGTVLFMFLHKGFNQVIFPSRCGTAFHQQHDDGRSKRNIYADYGISQFENCLLAANRTFQKRDFSSCISASGATSALMHRVGQINWGLANETFVEIA